MESAGTSLDSIISSFNTRIAHLKELVIARNMYPASSLSDLSAVDTALISMELQVQQIKLRLLQESQVIPKANKLIEAALRQQKKLQKLTVDVPPIRPERTTVTPHIRGFNPESETYNLENSIRSLNIEEDHDKPHKGGKGRGSRPLWYISSEELDSLSSYMRGRLTLEKVNAAITDMSSYAEANAHLVNAPRKKLSEKDMDKALELRDIASTEAVKGNHFFLEADIKGPSLKLDNTGKGILTVLRHLGRITETRIGHHRVIILLKPQ